MKKPDKDAIERSRALERLRAIDWPAIFVVIGGYAGEQRPGTRFRYAAQFCYGHFKNQGGSIAVGHLCADTHRAALDHIRATHPDRRNALPEPMLSALKIDLLQDNISVEQAEAFAKRYGARLHVGQASNLRGEAVARMFLQLSEKGLGFMDWAWSIIRHGIS